MPSLFMMTDAKDTTFETPVVITQMAADAPKRRNTKKYVIIAVTAILSVAIILTAILVGMYLFTQGQKEILKYTLNVDKDTKEEITADQNENAVQYHVQNVDYEMWVVDDFNRDIEVMKIQTKTETNCYVVPLNRTAAADPSKVKPPSNVDAKRNVTERLTYDVASTPIPDASFLGKKAKELCKGTSVYWMYPKCGNGSVCPPLKDGTLRLYSMRFCPFAERTRLVLAHYKIPHEVVNINLKSSPEWFSKKNPLALVPVLEQGNKTIYESAICNEYLDEVYGKQSLLTADPYERARQKILMERFSKVFFSLYAMLMQSGDERHQIIESTQKVLDVFEETLTGQFFGGAAPKMLDYHIWPWFERKEMLQKLTGVDPLPKSRFPKLNSWVSRMKDLPAVKAALVGTDLHVKFIEGGLLKNSPPDYDIGLD